jgi:hypothetical protein
VCDPYTGVFARPAMTTTVASPALSYRVISQTDGPVGALVGGPFAAYKKIRNDKAKFMPSLLWSLTAGTLLGLAGGLIAIVFLKVLFWAGWVVDLFEDDDDNVLAYQCHNVWTVVILLAIGVICATLDANFNKSLSPAEIEELKIQHYAQFAACFVFAFLTAWFTIGTVAWLLYDKDDTAIVNKGAVPLMSRYGFPFYWDDVPLLNSKAYEVCNWM